MLSPREFNPPALMSARLAYVVRLGLIAWSSALGVGGWIEGRPELGVEAAVAFTLAASLGWMLRRTHRMEECRDSLNGLFDEEDEDAGDPEADADPRLAALLEQRAALERRRGSAGFDPWELLALQHEIKECRRLGRSSGEGKSEGAKGRHAADRPPG